MGIRLRSADLADCSSGGARMVPPAHDDTAEPASKRGPLSTIKCPSLFSAWRARSAGLLPLDYQSQSCGDYLLHRKRRRPAALGRRHFTFGIGLHWPCVAAERHVRASESFEWHSVERPDRSHFL